MGDRAMQALYRLALDPIAETTADPNSYGFRTSRATADAIAQCFTALARQDRAQWVLAEDSKSCFDRISHNWLLAYIPTERVILQKWRKAGFMERHAFSPTEEGTPQGGILSPVLATLTRDGIERVLRDSVPAGRRKARQAKVNRVLLHPNGHRQVHNQGLYVEKPRPARDEQEA